MNDKIKGWHKLTEDRPHLDTPILVFDKGE